MLVQLRAATALGDALATLFHDVRYNTHQGKPVAYVPIEAAIPLMQAWLQWLQVAPSGDDWAPAQVPPAEITIPNIPDPPADDPGDPPVGSPE